MVVKAKEGALFFRKDSSTLLVSTATARPPPPRGHSQKSTVYCNSPPRGFMGVQYVLQTFPGTLQYSAVCTAAEKFVGLNVDTPRPTYQSPLNTK